MHNDPSVEDLLTGVKNFILETAAPELKGHSAFHARVAVNVLDIVLRDLSSRPGAEDWERATLRALLDDSDDDLSSLTQRLCDKIRNGEIEWSSPGVADYLTGSAMRQMAVDQPRYSGYRTAKSRSRTP